MKIEFRKVQSNDRSLLGDFFLTNNVPIILENFTAFPLTLETVDNICLKPHKDKYYIYIEDNKIKGFSMLRGWDEGFEIPSFGIFIDYRELGLGLGRIVLKLTLDECFRIGCKKVRLSVYAKNQSAVNLYTKFGFYETERKKIIVAGKSVEKITMIKDLL